jgi:hypothetical protein
VISVDDDPDRLGLSYSSVDPKGRLSGFFGAQTQVGSDCAIITGAQSN